MQVIPDLFKDILYSSGHDFEMLCDVSPDMSVSLPRTGGPEGWSWSCQPGSRASEAIESCSSSIRQAGTLRSARHYVARVYIAQAPPGAPVSAPGLAAADCSDFQVSRMTL